MIISANMAKRGTFKQPYERLEFEWARFAGAKYAVSCNSGTSALHLALMALGVKAGDEVIVPDFAMAACAFAVSYCHAAPKFVDVEPGTYGLRPDEVERAITERTKAIIVVHTYGRLADIQAILKIAKKWKVAVIEDAAEAQGAIYESGADITCYSFYKNKIIHAEEGGIITTNKKHLADQVRYLKNMAFGRRHDYFHKVIGYNYRMPDSQAALALVSLHEYPKNKARRREIEWWYDKELGLAIKGQSRAAVWFYEYWAGSKRILKREPKSRDSFKPLSSLPMYGGGSGKETAQMLSANLVLLPVEPGMTRDDVKKICQKL